MPGVFYQVGRGLSQFQISANFHGKRIKMLILIVCYLNSICIFWLICLLSNFVNVATSSACPVAGILEFICSSFVKASATCGFYTSTPLTTTGKGADLRFAWKDFMFRCLGCSLNWTLNRLDDLRYLWHWCVSSNSTSLFVWLTLCNTMTCGRARKWWRLGLRKEFRGTTYAHCSRWPGLFQGSPAFIGYGGAQTTPISQG